MPTRGRSEFVRGPSDHTSTSSSMRAWPRSSERDVCVCDMQLRARLGSLREEEVCEGACEGKGHWRLSKR